MYGKSGHLQPCLPWPKQIFEAKTISFPNPYQVVCVSRFDFWLLYFVAHIRVCNVLLSISCLVLFPILFLRCYARSPVIMCPLCPCFVLTGFWFVFSFVFILYFFPWTILCWLFVVCISGYGLWALDISSLFLSSCLHLGPRHFCKAKHFVP